MLDEVDPGWRSHFAAILGVGRTSYYCPPTVRTTRDELAVGELTLAHQEHPFYGVRRFALHLGWSEKKSKKNTDISRYCRADRRQTAQVQTWR